MKKINQYLQKALDPQNKVMLYNNVDLVVVGIDSMDGIDYNVFGLVTYDNDGEVLDVKLLTGQAAMVIYFQLDRLLGYDTFATLEEESDDDDELE